MTSHIRHSEEGAKKLAHDLRAKGLTVTIQEAFKYGSGKKLGRPNKVWVVYSYR